MPLSLYWDRLASAIASHPRADRRSEFTWPTPPGRQVALRQLATCVPASGRSFMDRLGLLITNAWAVDLHGLYPTDAESILARASAEHLVLVNHGKGQGVLEELCHQTMVAAGFERVAQGGHTQKRPQNGVSVFASRTLLHTLVSLEEADERVRARRIEDIEQRREREREQEREAEQARARTKVGGANERRDSESAEPRPSRVTHWGQVAARGVLLVGAVVCLLRKRR